MMTDEELQKGLSRGLYQSERRSRVSPETQHVCNG